jgi:hypothetical protein
MSWGRAREVELRGGLLRAARDLIGNRDQLREVVQDPGEGYGATPVR